MTDKCLKSLILIFLLTTFAGSIAAKADLLEGSLVCTVKDHRVFLMMQGELNEFSGFGDEAPIGSDMDIKIKFSKGLMLLSWSGKSVSPRTKISGAGHFEKRTSEVKAFSKNSLNFYLAGGGYLGSDKMRLGQAEKQLNLTNYTAQKWHGTIDESGFAEGTGVDALTFVDCKMRGSGYREIITFLEKEGF